MKRPSRNKSTRNKSKTFKEERDDDFVDDDTMYFIQLWDYVQSFEQSLFDQLFSAEDVVFLNELVDGQNFSVALDMLRQKVAPVRKKLPEELQDIARLPRCRKVAVKPVNEHVTQPELEEFRERLRNAKTFVPIPPEKSAEFLNEMEEQPSNSSSSSLIKDQNAAYEEALLEDQMKEVIEKSLISYQMEQVNDPDPLWTKKRDEENLQCETNNSVDEKTEVILPPEPKENDDDSVTVQVTIPFKEGQKVERRFRLSCDLVGAVLGWISNIVNVDEDNLALCTNFPKKFYSFLTPLTKCPIQRKRIQFFCELKTN